MTNGWRYLKYTNNKGTTYNSQGSYHIGVNKGHSMQCDEPAHLMGDGVEHLACPVSEGNLLSGHRFADMREVLQKQVSPDRFGVGFGVIDTKHQET